MKRIDITSAISYMAYSWRRAITDWVTQQYPLYLWSIVLGAYTVYIACVQYVGPVVLFGVTWLLNLVIPEDVPLLSMIIIALSIMIMRPKVLHTGLFMQVSDMYLNCVAICKRIWYGRRSGRTDAYLRGHALEAHVVMMVFQLAVWVLSYAPWLFRIHLYMPYLSWHHVAIVSGIIPFTCFFLCDGGYTGRSLLRAPLRALRLLWFNLPVCIGVGMIAWVWAWCMALWSYLYILDVVSIPLWISIWYTIYIKSIYEQFSRYYGDTYACGSDTA